MLDINLDSKSDVKSDSDYRYFFKHSDEVVNKWFEAQSNKSFSLKYIIHKMISLYGYEDMQDIAIKEFVAGSSGDSEAEDERREAEFERRIGRLVLYGRS